MQKCLVPLSVLDRLVDLGLPRNLQWRSSQDILKSLLPICIISVFAYFSFKSFEDTVSVISQQSTTVLQLPC